MKPRRLRRVLVLAALLMAYPVGVLGITWGYVARSDFKGGRHGPLDAYRHALASAIVSYTLGEWAVELVTDLFERKPRSSHRMDRHNNRIGARIGSQVTSFGAIEPAIRASVLQGAPDARDPHQITWLPATQWRDGKFW